MLLMEPLPYINCVFSFIMQQERQEKQGVKITNKNIKSKILANTVDKQNRWKLAQTWRSQGRGVGSRGQGRGIGRNPNNGKQCSYCQKMNHIVDECYSKHDYPPWTRKMTTTVKRVEDRVIRTLPTSTRVTLPLQKHNVPNRLTLSSVLLLQNRFKNC